MIVAWGHASGRHAIANSYCQAAQVGLAGARPFAGASKYRAHIAAESRSMRTGSDQEYLCGAGHARAVWIRPENPEQRLVWGRWLKGLTSVIAATSAVAWIAASANLTRPLEATAQMERLAGKIERAKMLDQETVHEIARLIRQPAYDCNQIACTTQLQARNSAARASLAKAVARHESPVIEAAAAPRQADDASTTGSTK